MYIAEFTTIFCETDVKSKQTINGLIIMCFKKKILALESHAEKKINACKAEQIPKMTTIFTQNDNQGPF